MTGRGAATEVNALALRLLSFVLIAGGAVALALAWSVAQWRRIVRDGTTLYVLPGSDGHNFVDPKVVTVLGSVGIVMAGVGLVGAVLARSLASSREPGPRSSVVAGTSSRTRRARLILVLGVAMLIGALGWRLTHPHAIGDPARDRISPASPG